MITTQHPLIFNAFFQQDCNSFKMAGYACITYLLAAFMANQNEQLLYGILAINETTCMHVFL